MVLGKSREKEKIKVMGSGLMLTMSLLKWV